jgi:murein DD-endopeptidase MepM/ murein hydrolase activator NlpD
MLRHLFIDGRPIYTQYAHLSEILVTQGETVERGSPIGLSGETCTCYPHIHFDVRSAPNDTDYWAFLDPYVPVVQVPTGFWLSGEPLPQWTDEYHPADGISFWTVENSPQHPR